MERQRKHIQICLPSLHDPAWYRSLRGTKSSVEGPTGPLVLRPVRFSTIEQKSNFSDNLILRIMPWKQMNIWPLPDFWMRSTCDDKPSLEEELDWVITKGSFDDSTTSIRISYSSALGENILPKLMYSTDLGPVKCHRPNIMYKRTVFNQMTIQKIYYILMVLVDFLYKSQFYEFAKFRGIFTPQLRSHILNKMCSTFPPQSSFDHIDSYCSSILIGALCWPKIKFYRKRRNFCKNSDFFEFEKSHLGKWFIIQFSRSKLCEYNS